LVDDESFDEAERSSRRHLELLQARHQWLQGKHVEVGMSLNDLAVLLREMGRLEEASSLNIESINILRALSTGVENEGQREIVLENLAQAFYTAGTLKKLLGEEASSILTPFDEALSINTALLGVSHPDVLRDAHELATLRRCLVSIST